MIVNTVENMYTSENAIINYYKKSYILQGNKILMIRLVKPVACKVWILMGI